MKKKFNIFLICIVFIMIAFDIVNQIHNGREYSLSNLQIGLIVIAVVVYCVMSLIVGVGIYLKKRNENVVLHNGRELFVSVCFGFVFWTSYLLDDGRKVNKGNPWSTKERERFYNILSICCLAYMAICLCDGNIYWLLYLSILLISILLNYNKAYSKKRCDEAYSQKPCQEDLQEELVKQPVTTKDSIISFLRALLLAVLIAVFLVLIYVVPNIDTYMLGFIQSKAPVWSWIACETEYVTLPCDLETIQENIVLDEGDVQLENDVFQKNYPWGNVQYHVYTKQNGFEFIDNVIFNREKTDQNVEDVKIGNGMQFGDSKEEIISKNGTEDLQVMENDKSDDWVLQYNNAGYQMVLRGNDYGLNMIEIAWLHE